MTVVCDQCYYAAEQVVLSAFQDAYDQAEAMNRSRNISRLELEAFIARIGDLLRQGNCVKVTAKNGILCAETL